MRLLQARTVIPRGWAVPSTSLDAPGAMQRDPGKVSD